VLSKAREIVGARTAPLENARAIYDWIVDNTFRRAETRGCGLGNIAFMLETGDMGGKCADINSLYVGLARAAGLPARDFFGIRVAESAVSKSLGKSGDITKAQHCRAEVFIEGKGWLPVDPADVRKVVLEEGVAVESDKVKREFDLTVAPIELAPQEITRVFLNLFGNGFYAANKRVGGNGEAGYRPTLRVSTRDLGDDVEIRVRDNGTGIAPEIRDKLFQPFVTTKPTGEGTGLGLSIAWDIVTQQHGGIIAVESQLGEFTEFTIRLPRRAVGGTV
jgi:signal transduction histidine kinase